jgi:protein SPT2
VSVAPLKRKADSDLPRRSDKSSRHDPSAAAPPRVITSAQKVPVTTAATPKPGRPLPSLSSASKTPVSRPSSTLPNSEPSKVSAVKIPKKGSFAEIMARAKAAQTTMAQVGKIQHKRIEKGPSKREREEMKSINRDASGKAKRKGPTPPLRDGRNGARENGRGSRTTSVEAEKKPKKAAAATTGYTGTARPNPATVKKPQPQSYGSSSRERDRPGPGPSRQRYTYAASEDDEEEDYESDVSSDMEAAVFEVDEEEERAARLARKEDALALAEENRLKMEKEEKRRKLAAMAKTRR